MRDHKQPERREPAQASDHDDYEPPQAEDVDTTAEPSETEAGVGGGSRLAGGVEESGQWH